MTYQRNLIFIVICAILCLGHIGVASAGQYDYVVPPAELWGCFDYAMHYSQGNPDWGIVLISDHPRFKGIGNSHFVNYQIYDKTLVIYDAEKGSYSYLLGWQYDTFTFDYYHFYVNGEIPTRYLGYKLPNAEAIYNAL